MIAGAYGTAFSLEGSITPLPDDEGKGQLIGAARPKLQQHRKAAPSPSDSRAGTGTLHLPLTREVGDGRNGETNLAPGHNGGQ